MWLSQTTSVSLLYKVLRTALIPTLTLQLCPKDPALASPSQSMSEGSRLTRSKLYKDSRERLAIATVNSQKDTLLVIASTVGSNELVARLIFKSAGTVLYRNDAVDYVRATIPTSKVNSLLSSPEVESAEVDVDFPISSGSPTSRPAISPDPPEANTIGSTPGPDTALSNPYLPTKDIGVPQLMAKHPTFDGRGVAVAMIDSGLDLLVPELQTAKTIDGKEVPKILDYLTSTEPTDREDPTWVNMSDSVTAREKQFTYRGVSYTAPAVGFYRIGQLIDPTIYTTFIKDNVNFHGNSADTKSVFAVIWDESTNTVWVDTNQNQSFADEKAMQEYAIRQDLGIFGRDNPATPTRESIGFTVQIRRKEKYININLGRGAHGTGSAGVAVGKAYFGGQMSAPAPEAQILFVRTGRSIHSFIKAMIMAAEDPRVEAISEQAGVITDGRQDGKAVDTVIVNRLIRRYNKLFIHPAGNSAGVNSIFDR